MQLAQLLVDEIAQGWICGPIVLGFVLVCRIALTASFAQGEQMMRGALIAW